MIPGSTALKRSDLGQARHDLHGLGPERHLVPLHPGEVYHTASIEAATAAAWKEA